MSTVTPWLAAVLSAEAAARLIGHVLDRVTLSVPHHQDAAVLKLGWRAAWPWEPSKSPVHGVTVTGYSKPPDSLMLVNRPGEDRIIACAWERGAVRLHRYEFRSLSQTHPGGDPWDDKFGITALFGGMAEYANAFGPLIGQCTAPGCADMVPMAAEVGYVSYMFVPGKAVREDVPPAWATVRQLGLPRNSDGHMHIWTFEGKSLRRPFSPRATDRQRACIMALRRDTAVDCGAPLPARLTMAEASAMIDRLRALEQSMRL